MHYRLLPTLSLLALLTAGHAAPVAAEEFSHADWTAVLARFVDEQGQVDYEGLASDRAIFDRYVRTVETTGPTSHPELFPTRAHQLAYYLNAYNALVFQGVLARGPEKESVWSGLISGYNFFVKMKVKVDGEETTLKKLEDDVVRARFEDPRVHAALNCASIGCPRLPREAFEAPTSIPRSTPRCANSSPKSATAGSTRPRKPSSCRRSSTGSRPIS
ncbi:MAG: DUF547 domain-containing protein [Thermoanaerobaculia bacterium]|nr:DUF547 domain-containing protein [Thermoanaerobaculia bacterium]